MNETRAATRRDARGLTQLMVALLPRFVVAPDVRAELKQCMREGLLSDSWYYRKWNKDEHWIAALNAEREEYYKQVVTRIKRKAITHADEALAQLVKIMKGGQENGQRAACEDILLLAGVREFAKSSSVNVKQTMGVGIAETRTRRTSRLEAHVAGEDRVSATANRN